MNSSTRNTLLALMTGTAVGGVLSILYAPDSGSKTRTKIKSKASEATQELTQKIKQAKEELTVAAQEKKVDFEEKIDKVITNASFKADDIIAKLEQKLETLRKKNATLQKSS